MTSILNLRRWALWAKACAGKLYVDVGNAFVPGVLDHHHPDAPNACTATLVLNHPDYVRSQLLNRSLTIIPHIYPDLDAITGAYLARIYALNEPMEAAHKQWAEYVCKVDQGFTKLRQQSPVSPYSVFMMDMHQVCNQESPNLSLLMLERGFAFIDKIITSMQAGYDLNETGWLQTVFPLESGQVHDDFSLYVKDLKSTSQITLKLPVKNRPEHEPVPGLWVEKPRSVLFKSWARGDTEHSHCPDGFMFLGIQVSATRFILSVQPDSPVWLKGLGDALEQAETQKRERIGQVRQGKNRPGYQSPDPWYGGNSPLHNYSIIDSPRCGSVLLFSEVKGVVDAYTQNLPD